MPDSKEHSVKLSLCMILKDEEFFLARCLDAIKDFVDEIVLVDTGSSDSSIEICRQYTDRVFEFPWIDDFSAARNYSLDQAEGDWILVLDADEIIVPSDLESIRTLIEHTEDDVFMLRQLNYSNNPEELDWQPLVEDQVFGWNYTGFCVNPIARLFRNRSDIRYVGKVHEVVDLSDEGVRHTALEVPIHHDINGNPGKGREKRQLNYLRIMEEALLVSPQGRLASQAGTVRMYHMQDYRGAIAHLEQAVALGHDRERNLESIAEAYYRLGEHSTAEKFFSELYSSGFATPTLCNNYANLLVKADKLPQAIEVLERGLSLGHTDPAWIARVRHNLKYLRRQCSQHS